MGLFGKKKEQSERKQVKINKNKIKLFIFSTLIVLFLGACSATGSITGNNLNGKYESTDDELPFTMDIDGDVANFSLYDQTLIGDVDSSENQITFDQYGKSLTLNYTIKDNSLTLLSDYYGSISLEKKSDSNEKSKKSLYSDCYYSDMFTLLIGEYEVGVDSGIKPESYTVRYNSNGYENLENESSKNYIKVTSNNVVNMYEFSASNDLHQVILKPNDIVTISLENYMSDYSFQRSSLIDY